MASSRALQAHSLDWFSLVAGVVTVMAAVQSQLNVWNGVADWSLMSYLLPLALVTFGVMGLVRGRRRQAEPGDGERSESSIDSQH